MGGGLIGTLTSSSPANSQFLSLQFDISPSFSTPFPLIYFNIWFWSCIE